MNTQHQLALAYAGRATAKMTRSDFDPDAAIADFDKAVKLLEGLPTTDGRDPSQSWRLDLANTLMNRGAAKRNAPRFGPTEAIADYDAAIEILEAFHDRSYGPLQGYLASAYLNRGNAKQDASRFGPGAAINDYDAAIRQMEALRNARGDDWPASGQNDLAAAYMNRGNAKQLAPGFGAEAAIADYDAAITLMRALRDQLGDEYPILWRNELANAYMNLGVAKLSAPGFGPGAAIADYDAAITLQETLRHTLGDGWPVSWGNDLAAAYVNRGNAKQSALGPGAAIADYDAAISLREALRHMLGDGWPMPWRNDLAAAYMNRGNAKQSAPGFGPGAAIADYDVAITLREALCFTLGDGWPVPWRNDLAAAYMNRGNAKQDTPGFGPGTAIADYDVAITLMAALRDTLGDGWPVPWRNDFAAAYMNRGVAKQDILGFGSGSAIADFDVAIELREELRDTLDGGWPVPWRNDLAGTYVNRANAKQSAPEFGPGAAIADYDVAIALMEALRDTLGDGWPVPWRNDLARAYVNRGNAKQTDPGFGPEAAIADYDAAIALREALHDMLGDGWPLPWRADLASAYFNRARARAFVGGLAGAAADARAAKRIAETLVAEYASDASPFWRQVATAAAELETEIEAASDTDDPRPYPVR